MNVRACYKCGIFNIGCKFNGQIYQEGDMIRPNCSTHCTCKGNIFNCTNESCILDGPTCTVYGDPHYVTFDRRRYNFMGTCEYVLSRPCDSNDFIIVGRNVPLSHNPFASVTESVRILVKDGTEILLERGNGGSITINGDLQPNTGDGVVYNSNGVEVYRTGRHPYVLLKLEGSFPLGIYWDGRRRVRITVSKRWQGLLCGQCGYYNEDRRDDFRLPDRSQTSSVDMFANSWEHAKTADDCGVPPPPPNCSADVQEAAMQRCNVLTNEIFQLCNDVVDPSDFVLACMFDYCNCAEENREECFCGVVRSYAAHCASEYHFIPNELITQICRKLSK